MNLEILNGISRIGEVPGFDMSQISESVRLQMGILAVGNKATRETLISLVKLGSAVTKEQVDRALNRKKK